MKTFKILFAAIIFAGFASTAFAQGGNAQTSDESSATASAVVWVPISITQEENADIDFGVIFAEAGQSPNLNPETGAISDAGYLGSDTSFGRFAITGEGGKGINIDIASSLTLLNGQEELTFEPAARFNDSNGFGGAVISTGGASTHNIDASGSNWIIIGGEITDLDGDTEAGTYEAVLDVKVEYNDI